MRKRQRRPRIRGFAVLCVSIRARGYCIPDMAIKDEIKRRAVEKLIPKYVKRYLEDPAWAWTEVREAAQNANSEGREEITREIINTRVIRAHLRSLAEAEVDGLLADDSLNLNELNRVFG